MSVLTTLRRLLAVYRELQELRQLRQDSGPDADAARDRSRDDRREEAR